MGCDGHFLKNFSKSVEKEIKIVTKDNRGKLKILKKKIKKYVQKDKDPILASFRLLFRRYF